MNFFSSIPKRMLGVLDAQREPEGEHKVADFFWRATLVAGIVVVACAIAYGALDMSNVLGELSQPLSGSSVPAPAIDRTALNALVQSFNARAAQYQALQSASGANIADPSK